MEAATFSSLFLLAEIKAERFGFSRGSIVENLAPSAALPPPNKRFEPLIRAIRPCGSTAKAWYQAAMATKKQENIELRRRAAETVGYADIASVDPSRRLPLILRDGTSVEWPTSWSHKERVD